MTSSRETFDIGVWSVIRLCLHRKTASDNAALGGGVRSNSGCSISTGGYDSGYTSGTSTGSYGNSGYSSNCGSNSGCSTSTGGYSTGSRYSGSGYTSSTSGYRSY